VAERWWVLLLLLAAEEIFSFFSAILCGELIFWLLRFPASSFII